MDKNDSDWMHTCLRIIEWSTSLWGGWYSVIIPTDGEEIAEPFWEILKAFDPDYLYTYQKTGLDLQISHPEKFAEDFDRRLIEWMRSYPDQDSTYSRNQILDWCLKREIDILELSDNLKKQMYTRLNPFEYGDEEYRIVYGCIARQEGGIYPLTELKFPLQGFAKRSIAERIGTFVDLDIDASLPIQLMVHSLYGKFWSKQRELLPTSDSVRVSFATPSLSEIGDILGNLWDNQRHMYEGTPAAASLLKCVFYRSRRNNKPNTPQLFILGDGLEDYCLYYSLSRLRRSVIWLPKSLLEAYGARHLNTIIPDSIISKDEASLAFTAFVPMMRNKFDSGNPLFSFSFR